jgi:hypothetical protein
VIVLEVVGASDQIVDELLHWFLLLGLIQQLRVRTSQTKRKNINKLAKKNYRYTIQTKRKSKQ